MARTDSPLQLYFRHNVKEIASWLLGADVVSAQHHPLKLVRAKFEIDSAYVVQLANGKHCLLHVEFQGRRTHMPMPRRQLNYLTLLAMENDWPLSIESFVIYVEKGAGKNDTGQHTITRLDGSAALTWRYKVIRLWEESAEALLKHNRPAIMPFIGLMKVESPETTLPAVLEQIDSEPNAENRADLFGTLIALLSDQELIKMVKRYIEEEGLLMNTPFLRELRQNERLTTARKYTIMTIRERFNPPVKQFATIENQLHELDSDEAMDQLFSYALTLPTLEGFLEVLEQQFAEFTEREVGDD